MITYTITFKQAGKFVQVDVDAPPVASVTPGEMHTALEFKKAIDEFKRRTAALVIREGIPGQNKAN